MVRIWTRGVAVVGVVFGGVDAGGGRFLGHGACGRIEGDEEADFGVLAGHVALEGGYHVAADVSALYLDDDALGSAAVVVEEVDVAVYAGVGAAASSVGGAGVHEAQCPVLELVASVVFALDGEGSRAFDVLWDSHHVVVGEVGAEGVAESALHEGYGEVGYVYAYPPAVEAFGDGDSGAASAEGVEDDVALVAGGVYDALEQGFGLLGGVAEAFAGLRADRVDICHDILNWNPRALVRVSLLTWNPAARRPVNQTRVV